MISGMLVTLGPILPTDFPNLFMWADDLEAAALNEHYRPAVWRNQDEFWMNIGNDSSKIYFAIRKRQDVNIIGYVQIWSIDPVHRSAIMGIRIGDAVNRGKGFGSDALSLAIDYCWKHLNISRISLMVFENNQRAIKLYAAHGFEEEGRLRKAVYIGGKWLDVVLMGLMHPSRTSNEAYTPAP